MKTKINGTLMNLPLGISIILFLPPQEIHSKIYRTQISQKKHDTIKTIMRSPPKWKLNGKLKNNYTANNYIK